MRKAVLGAILAASVAGCASRQRAVPPAPEPATAAAQVVTLDWGGLHRSYLLHRPLKAVASPAVVVVLHGASLTAAQTERYYHWDKLADDAGFVVVYPEGVGKAWNAGSCCSGAPARGTDDVGFVGAVLDDARAKVGADPRRLYVSGVSNGAMLALRYACERQGEVAAIGSVAGTFTAPCPHPPPVPLLEIHGLHDRAVPYLAGEGTEESGPALRLPASETIERWRSANGCETPATSGDPPVHIATSTCAKGVEVKVITIDGAGHQWPGAVLDPARAAYDGPDDQPDRHVDATAELWAFFDHHPRS